MSLPPPQNQPRSADGRYSEYPHSAPEVALQGSFLFPPAQWADVDEFIEFWVNVPIGEAELLRFCSAYRANRDVWFDEELNRRKREIDNTYEAYRYAKVWGTAKWEEYRQPQVDAIIAELNDRRPPMIPPARARELARVFQMGKHGDWPGITNDEVDRYGSVTMFYEGLEPQTVLSLWHKYAFGELPAHAITDDNFAESVLRREQV